ncbi:hypothetical protein CR513_44349, partial [Mucuna pruriens]
MSIHLRVESNSGNEGQKQAEAEAISDNRRKAESNSSNRTEAESILDNLSRKQSKVEIMLAQLVLNLNQVGQSDLKPTNVISSSPLPPTELKSLPIHLKYAYLSNDQQIVVIIAKNLHQEQEEKLLHFLRQHKKAIGHKPLHLYAQNFNGGGSPSNKEITKKAESDHLRRGQEGSNQTASCRDDLSHIGQIMVQVVRKKSRMTIIKNQHDELVPINQVLEKLARKSHYCFLDGFSSYMQIHIAPED